MLARVFATEPEMFLLDEPTADLDPAASHAILRLLRVTAEAGAAVVVVLHAVELAAEYAHRIMLVDHGRICHRRASRWPGLCRKRRRCSACVLAPDLACCRSHERPASLRREKLQRKAAQPGVDDYVAGLARAACMAAVTVALLFRAPGIPVADDPHRRGRAGDGGAQRRAHPGRSASDVKPASGEAAALRKNRPRLRHGAAG